MNPPTFKINIQNSNAIKIAKDIIQAYRNGSITKSEAYAQMYLITYGEKPDVESVRMLHELKSYPSPVCRDHDPHYERIPWQKFGTITSGICQAWEWYQDDVILFEKRASRDEIKAALDLTSTEYANLKYEVYIPTNGKEQE